jgi:hypothetical protein
MREPQKPGADLVVRNRSRVRVRHSDSGRKGSGFGRLILNLGGLRLHCGRIAHRLRGCTYTVAVIQGNRVKEHVTNC